MTFTGPSPLELWVFLNYGAGVSSIPETITFVYSPLHEAYINKGFSFKNQISIKDVINRSAAWISLGVNVKTGPVFRLVRSIKRRAAGFRKGCIIHIAKGMIRVDPALVIPGWEKPKFKQSEYPSKQVFRALEVDL